MFPPGAYLNMIQNISNLVMFGRYSGEYIESLPTFEYEMLLIMLNEVNKTKNETRFDMA